jgi:nucleoside-diphosphate-sugar epimerase
MTVLIVGTGLVGSQVLRLEIERGERPIVIDAQPRIEALEDICDPSQAKIIQANIQNAEEVSRIVADENVTRLIHTAANPLLTMGAQQNPKEAIMTNIVGTVNLLEASRQSKVERFIFASSNVLSYHVKPHVDNQMRPTSIYGSTKLACEYIGLNYCDTYGLDFVGLRFTAVFGPWRYGGGGGPTQRFKQLLENALSEGAASISRERLEFVYSKDAANACVLACHKEDAIEDKILNVGMGKIYDPAEIVTIIQKYAPQAKIELVDKPSTSIEKAKEEQAMNLATARKQIGYEPSFMMEEAIEDYVSWLREKTQVSRP